MKVSAQYAESHLEELLDATEKGQSVEIARPNRASVKLTLVPAAEKFDRSGMFGSGKGMIWMADDWDSPEASEEIARLFNESPLFPDQS
jgi:antitoxin (DNA-binding transcriptional repressor) of toxin-antitoxin stability system